MQTLHSLRRTVQRLSRKVEALGVRSQDLRHPTLARLRDDPALPMRVMGLTPDPWQEALIQCEARQITMLCTRRAGKSRTAACRVLARSLTTSRFSTLIFCPTEDQSKEFLGYVREMNEEIGCPVPLVRESMGELAWANGSRVRAKADSPKGSRGFTPDLIVLDEGAQVSDELYLSVRPMMALGKAELMALSTPFGKAGWFFDLWSEHERLAHWQTFRVTAYECPRIDQGWLESERASLPPRWFAQEFLCEFNDAVDAVFGRDVIESAVRIGDDFLPLDLGA